MRLNFSTSWIFRGWITCVLVTIYSQTVVSKVQQCGEKQYLRFSRCCDKCGPGFRVFHDCTDTEVTACVKCSTGNFQSGWTAEKRCQPQKFCDGGKGFMEVPDNPIKEETCRCLPGHQCDRINCEYCEEIPTCRPGYGLELDPDSTNGRMMCVECKKGFFNAGNDAAPCKEWTNCKSEGRTETQPGTAKSDAACGPLFSGATASWVIVSVLSVIIVLSLLILVLFCYKDKLTLLSVNLRACVQNLKRTRIQQETLAPLYHSGIGGGNPGGPKCSPCETTKLICQAPQSPVDDPLCTLPTPASDIKVSLPFTTEKEAVEDQSEGSGQPEEVSEEEEEEVSVPPLVAGPCVCVIPIREPLEVGENEDCSQAVSPGTPGTCSCGGLDGERDAEEAITKEKSSSETAMASLSVSLTTPLLQSASVVSPSGCPAEGPLLGLNDSSSVLQEGLYRLSSTDSSENSSAMSSGSPLVTSSSLGQIHPDKNSEGLELRLGGSWGDNKLSSEDSQLECSPESLHSQLAEPTLTSGQVSGNNNTTFISSGQVMNFSGDVIVVYVSQTSNGSDSPGRDGAFGNPVQEEANETAPFLQSSLGPQGDFVSHITYQDETLPVQEVMAERPLGK